jgi:hypothetical protein
VTPVAYDASYAAEWDALVTASVNGTLLHTRRFLGHQGDRFADASLLLRDDRDRLIGVLPAAYDPADPSVVVSHPGVTYGGLVHAGLGAAEVLAALTDATKAWAARGAETLRYKAVPRMYHRSPAEADLYALFRLGATRYRCDVSACIDLAAPLPVSRNRVRRRKAAEAAGVTVRRAVPDDIAALWAVVTANRADRYGVTPTHDEREVPLLLDLLPDEVVAHAALSQGEVLAAGLSFLTPTVWHTQYLAASPAGFEAGAQDLLVFALVDEARARGLRWLDFGISNEDGGRVLNESLHRYKEGYGAGAVVHEFYELGLSSG